MIIIDYISCPWSAYGKIKRIDYFRLKKDYNILLPQFKKIQFNRFYSIIRDYEIFCKSIFFKHRSVFTNWQLLLAQRIFLFENCKSKTSLNFFNFQLTSTFSPCLLVPHLIISILLEYFETPHFPQFTTQPIPSPSKGGGGVKVGVEVDSTVEGGRVCMGARVWTELEEWIFVYVRVCGWRGGGGGGCLDVWKSRGLEIRGDEEMYDCTKWWTCSFGF